MKSPIDTGSLSRRDFLQHSAGGSGGLALAALLQDEAAAAPLPLPPRPVITAPARAPSSRSSALAASVM